jgi:hypothetical protein
VLALTAAEVVELEALDRAALLRAFFFATRSPSSCGGDRGRLGP